MSSTRERDAFPKMFSLRTRLRFSSADASRSQWESSVLVSPIKAPALMILDVYGAVDRGVAWAGMVLAHRLPEFEFQFLAVLLDHGHQERRYAGTPSTSSGTFESDPIQQLPQIRWQV